MLLIVMLANILIKAIERMSNVGKHLYYSLVSPPTQSLFGTKNALFFGIHKSEEPPDYSILTR